jgi:hypothetical protein
VKPVTLTLDSQVVMTRDGAGDASGSWLQRLRGLEARGLVALGVSSRFFQDKLADKNDVRRVQDLDAAGRLQQIPAPLRFDESYWDGPDVFIGAEDDRTLRELERLFRVEPPHARRRMNTLRDVDHLSAHWMSRREYFVTSDRGILRKRQALAPLGIRVVEPRAVVEVVPEDPDAFRGALEAAWRASLDATA